MHLPVTYLLPLTLYFLSFPFSHGVIYYHSGSPWPMDRHIYQGKYFTRALFPLHESHRNPFWGRERSDPAPKFLQPTTITTTTTTTTTTPSPPKEYSAWPCVGELEAFDRVRRKCFKLATQGGCDAGYWWILSKYNRPMCAKRHCKPFYAKHPNTGSCILLNDAERMRLCPKGNKFINDKYGNPRCVCRENHFRKILDQVSICHPSYEQGPCNSGFYILFNKQKNRVECQKNLCEVNGLVPVDGECKKLGDACGEHGEKNVYINPHDGVIGCYDFFRLPAER